MPVRVMVAASTTPSPALLEANRRLHQLRASLQPGSHHAGKPASTCPPQAASSPPWNEEDISTTDGPPDAIRQLAGLPEHLGWGSSNLAYALRRAQERRRETRAEAKAKELAWMSAEVASSKQQPADGRQPSATDEQSGQATSKPPSKYFVKVYPDIALGMLRNNVATAGRIWLLLRFLDREGRGWLRVERVKQKLTASNSKLRVCGWRQLCNLLREGEGVFWKQDEERIWLRSAAKVAAGLGVERLTGHPVALPVQALCAGMGQARAHLYASFHSGRRRQTPISRDTLEELTGVPARTQRAYEQAAGVEATTNIAVGEKHDDAIAQERAWRHGRATFDFIDHQGLQGPEGRRYIAWRLPNSYQGSHRRRPKGRQRKINRKLKDLVTQRAQGNGSSAVKRLFHPDGAKAARAYNRDADHDAFWPHGDGPLWSGVLWYVLPRQGE